MQIALLLIFLGTFFAVVSLIAGQPSLSALSLLSGIGMVLTAVLLLLLSTDRYLRSDVCDAMSITDTLWIGDMLSRTLPDYRGVYIPDRPAGKVILSMSVLPAPGVAHEISQGQTGICSYTFRSDSEEKGISLTPPGHGLYAYVRSIGAKFTPEGLENELNDAMVFGLEVIKRARVQSSNRFIRVSLQGISNASLCHAIRIANPEICEQAGCPVCSFVGCVVADATGKIIQVQSVATEGKDIYLTYLIM